LGALLIVLTFLLTTAASGRVAGLLAAGLVATLPDVLAHSGISYNDVPLALVLLAGCWSIDAAVRNPGLRQVLVAGLITGLAFSVKFSSIVLGPVALL